MKTREIAALSTLILAASTTFIARPTGDPARAACCYFAAKDKDINQPGQKAFISWNPHDKTETFTVQPKFEGNALDFGMVIPTPGRPKLDEMPRDFFKDLAMYTILMPLPQPIYSPLDPMPPMRRKLSKAFPSDEAPMIQDRRMPSVIVLESGVVGSLDYKIIVASDASGLFDWLKANHYSYAGDEGTLDFYITKKWFFTVMKIDSKQMKKAPDGSYLGEVTPTRFTFSTPECAYPLKITQQVVKDKTDALFYIQSPTEMDLADDWSWMHSYRSMYLTYMLGCGAGPQDQQELQKHSEWLQSKQAKDPGFETTKLEWSKKLGDAEISVLEDPQANYGRMGTGDLPPGAKVIAFGDFVKDMKAEYLKKNKTISKDVADEFVRMEDRYQPSKGVIVKYDESSLGKGFIYTRYAWYPGRDVPLADIKGLTRLKGHLQKGQWLTKFRRVLRKKEMTHDLFLTEVPKEKEQTYVRVMPTSPP
jgi:hypothetical protein